MEQNKEQALRRMKELASELLDASKAYYQESREIMSNFEYDKRYDELLRLEASTGIVLAGSPTQKVGYEVLSELPKEAHESPMLSLDKTKDVGELQEWLGDQKGLLSWKLDGLTIVLTYEGGRLVKAVTRGNGEIGEVITNNAKVFANIPLQIAYQGQLILRGEAVIRYSDFNRINEEIEDVDAKYKNPRNLCSGSVRQLNNEITAQRSVNFEAFMLVRALNAPEAAEQDTKATRHGAADAKEGTKAAGQGAAAAEQGAADAEKGTKAAEQRAAAAEQGAAAAEQGAAAAGQSAKAVEQGAAAAEVDFHNSRKEQFEWLKTQGFDVVEYKEVTRETLPETVRYFAEKIGSYDIPSDGLVLLLDDIAYGDSLGRTAKFPRNSIAFKWADEIRETHLTEIEWSASRTGLINPVAIFEPVELEGTTVSRASVHNISIMESLKLGLGDRITVYKANMIIPQIAENLTCSGTVQIPERCPVCGGATEIRQMNDVRSLYCTNPECQAKKIKSFTLLVSRDALNIDGLSEATLEKFIAAGFIHEYADIFHLDRHRDAILSMEGFGQKSYDNLIAASDTASHTTLPRVIYGLGIAGIGLANAKMLCRAFHSDFSAMRNAGKEELTAVDGIGEVLADAWISWFASEENNRQVDDLLAELAIEQEAESQEKDIFAGMTFVITGSVEHFANRKELQAVIEERGGKATGSVTSKTTYLINNDVSSNSSKNKKAKQLGVPIISEQDFLNMLNGEGEHYAD